MDEDTTVLLACKDFVEVVVDEAVGLLSRSGVVFPGFAKSELLAELVRPAADALFGSVFSFQKIKAVAKTKRLTSK